MFSHWKNSFSFLLTFWFLLFTDKQTEENHALDFKGMENITENYLISLVKLSFSSSLCDGPEPYS